MPVSQVFPPSLSKDRKVRWCRSLQVLALGVAIGLTTACSWIFARDLPPIGFEIKNELDQIVADVSSKVGITSGYISENILMSDVSAYGTD